MLTGLAPHPRPVAAAGCGCRPAAPGAVPGPTTPARSRVHLSDREVEVLVAWLHLETKEAVGRRLHISVGTVNTHLARVRAKFVAAGRPASTKASLVVRALQDGYVDLDSL